MPQLAQAVLETVGVPACLLQMGLQPIAVAAPRGHRDLRLQLAHQRQLRAVGLAQVLHDLLLLLLTHKSLQVQCRNRSGARPAANSHSRPRRRA